ncbi:MAG: mandelate racemase [Hyphomicrobiaceae bacterium]|nr:mandelate racemase [Hyphomicrobiaceae bacterium]
MKIEHITLRRLRIPLRAPYKLALGDVTHFDTILAQTVTDDGQGTGEATILTGYTDETIAESWTRACEMGKRLAGATSQDAKASIADEMRDVPFAATALTTAIEMAEGNANLRIEGPVAVPLLAGVNSTDASGYTTEIEEAIASGYDTLKIKVGFDLECDLARVAAIQRCNAGRTRLRIDANQGYTREDACAFASRIDPTDIELLEQPCHADDWASLEAVSKATNVPLMLDESIYDEADIERAADIGAAFVKLKLMKLMGLDRLAHALALIRTHGMEPVLGNGVAGDVGCWMEACVASRLTGNAGEMNGFLRQATPLANPQLQVKHGALQLEPGRAVTLNAGRLEKVTLETATFDRTGDAAAAPIIRLG